MKRERYIKKELIKLYGKQEAEKITVSAQDYYDQLLLQCKDAPKGEVFHLNNTILPATSFYKALLAQDGEHALEQTKTILLKLCQKGGKFLNRILFFPGMKGLFMKIMPKMALKLFGRECGFDYTNLRIEKNRIQMDMTVCPYRKYANLFHVPELMPVFCESDFATYGKLRGITFERTQTLGTGGSKCDFLFYRN